MTLKQLKTSINSINWTSLVDVDICTIENGMKKKHIQNIICKMQKKQKESSLRYGTKKYELDAVEKKKSTVCEFVFFLPIGFIGKRAFRKISSTE